MKNVIFISDIAYSTICFRKSFFNSYYRPRFPPDTREAIQGKELHRSLQDLFPDASFEVECQHELNGWVIKGKADIVTANAVYEYKFLKSLDSPVIPAYKIQAAAYSKSLGKSECYLVLVNRKNQESKKIPVKVDLYWKLFLKHASNLIEHLSTGKIPKQDCPRFFWACRNCIWRIICSELGLPHRRW